MSTASQSSGLISAERVLQGAPPRRACELIRNVSSPRRAQIKPLDGISAQVNTPAQPGELPSVFRRSLTHPGCTQQTGIKAAPASDQMSPGCLITSIHVLIFSEMLNEAVKCQRRCRGM